MKRASWHTTELMLKGAAPSCLQGRNWRGGVGIGRAHDKCHTCEARRAGADIG